MSQPPPVQPSRDRSAGSDVDTRRATLLPPSPVSPKAARDFTYDALASWHVAAPADDIVLVVDELVTNALRHAAGPIMVVLSVGADAIRVEVTDDSDDVLAELAQSDTRPGGRGLAIVAALSRAWGTSKLTAGGKTVWADLTADHRHLA
jgi:signal transduction histidine kinase